MYIYIYFYMLGFIGVYRERGTWRFIPHSIDTRNLIDCHPKPIIFSDIKLVFVVFCSVWYMTVEIWISIWGHKFGERCGYIFIFICVRVGLYI